jgi:uncharacterized protein YidB (DUF937 family)
MGLLDGLVSGIEGGKGARRPGLGDTLAAGAILALLVKGVRSYQASHPAPGGAGGALGGLLGGGGLGGLLGGLGGAGALGALVKRFQQHGHAEQATSWVGHGANQSIAPQDVSRVLGEDTLKELQQRTGLNRDELLQQLAEELPDAINAATPEGRLPTDDELHQIARPS